MDKSTATTPNKNKQTIAIIISILIALIMVSVVGVYYYGTNQSVPSTTQPSTNTITPTSTLKKPTTIPQVTITGKVMEVGFDYTVKSISANGIILNGEQGDFTIPLDKMTVTVMKKDSTDGYMEADTNVLKEGQTVKLTMIPGVSATLYIK